MKTELFKHVEGGKTYAAGETLFSQGDEPQGLMYIVQEGEIDILVDGRSIDSIGPGSLLGEIGLVDNKPRTATAVAKVESRVLPIDQKRFVFLVSHTPNFALQVIATIAKRLRDYRGS